MQETSHLDPRRRRWQPRRGSRAAFSHERGGGRRINRTTHLRSIQETNPPGSGTCGSTHSTVGSPAGQKERRPTHRQTQGSGENTESRASPSTMGRLVALGPLTGHPTSLEALGPTRVPRRTEQGPPSPRHGIHARRVPRTAHSLHLPRASMPGCLLSIRQGQTPLDDPTPPWEEVGAREPLAIPRRLLTGDPHNHEALDNIRASLYKPRRRRQESAPGEAATAVASFDSDRHKQPGQQRVRHESLGRTSEERKTPHQSAARPGARGKPEGLPCALHHWSPDLFKRELMP